MINLSELWLAIEGRVLALIHKTESRGCRVYRTTTQTITAGAFTALSWDTEDNDTDGCWASGNPTRLTAARDGYYLAGGSFSLDAAQITSADRMGIRVRKNGTIYLGGTDLHTVNGEAMVLGVASGQIWLSAGDYLEVVAYNGYAADKTVSAGSSGNQHINHGWLTRVG